MKRLGRFMAIVLMLSLFGCAGSSGFMVKDSFIEKAPPDKGVIYFMRPSGLGFAVHFQVWEGYDLVGVSQAKCYFTYECDPGKHLFIGRAENKRAIEVDVEAGKSYYVLLAVKAGGWKARMAFVPVTRGSEYWNVVEDYKQNLHYTIRKDDAIENWVAGRREKISFEIDEITNYLKTPEGSRYIVYLSKEDGR